MLPLFAVVVRKRMTASNPDHFWIVCIFSKKPKKVFISILFDLRVQVYRELRNLLKVRTRNRPGFGGMGSHPGY